MIIPDWARRHKYWWHSNMKNRDQAKVFFDKCVVRPKVKAAWEVIKNPDSDNVHQEQAWEVIYRLDQGYNGSDNANMLCGRLVQSACDAILLEGKEPAEVMASTYQQYMKYIPRNWDDGIDAAKWTQYETELESVIQNALVGLREVMAGTEIFGETELYGALPGNELGHKNLPDYAGVGDLKTKWSSRNSRTKSGFANNNLPKDLSGRFDIANVFQVAGGWAINGRKPVWLLYVNKDDYKILNQDNCDQLKPEYLEDVVKQIRLKNRITENMLKAASTPEELLSLVYPDWDNLGWNAPEGYLQEAKAIWSID